MDTTYAIGQRLMVGFPGTEIDPEFEALVREFKIGNVILFRRNVENKEQLTKLCFELRELILRDRYRSGGGSCDQALR